MRLITTTLLAALVLTGCATPPPIDRAAVPVTPEAYKAQMQAAPQSVADGHWDLVPPADAEPRGDWWKSFKDNTLDDLIKRALASNTELQSAAARLAQARALLSGAEADRMPQLGLGAGAARGPQVGQGPAAATLYTVGANLSYEIDLVGKLSQASRAATLDAQSREALLQSTRLMVEAEVAQNYFALRFADKERDLVRATLATYQETLSLTKRRYEAGDVAELDLVRIQGEVAGIKAEALALDRNRAELENALAVLLGEPASGFALPESSAQAVLPSVPGGLPSAMLARRPDVAAAERSLLAAQARVGVAQAAWFPSLTLTAAGGFASPELGDIFRWSARAWSVEGLLSLPIFDGGRRQAGVDSAKAGLDLAMADYRRQILQALREVEDSLSDLQLLARQADVQTQSVQFSTQATTLAESRYRNGLVSQLELLDARRLELKNRRQALQVSGTQYQAVVSLVRSLGGGW